MVVQKRLADDETLFTFRTNNSLVEVVVYETGDIVILEKKSTLADNTVLQQTNNAVGILAADKYTRTERTTGIAYNSLGYKIFTVWAEGQFKYNGSTVSAYHADGDWQRHLWGSTIGISDKGMGKVRNYTVSGYKYTKVYSRLYYEATFGIRWAGIVLNSDTVEVYVGSTVNGSLYGGAVRP